MSILNDQAPPLTIFFLIVIPLSHGTKHHTKFCFSFSPEHTKLMCSFRLGSIICDEIRGLTDQRILSEFVDKGLEIELFSEYNNFLQWGYRT